MIKIEKNIFNETHTNSEWGPLQGDIKMFESIKKH